MEPIRQNDSRKSFFIKRFFPFHKYFIQITNFQSLSPLFKKYHQLSNLITNIQKPLPTFKKYHQHPMDISILKTISPSFKNITNIIATNIIEIWSTFKPFTKISELSPTIHWYHQLGCIHYFVLQAFHAFCWPWEGTIFFKNDSIFKNFGHFKTIFSVWSTCD